MTIVGVTVDMHLNKKGQALVEFIIILPIFVMMLLCIVDIGKIIFYQNRLEGKMEDVITLYNNGNNYEKILNVIEKDESDVTLEIANDNNEYIEFKLIKELEILTPGLNLILDNPYKVDVKRVIYYDE